MYNNPCNASTSWLQHILLFFFFYHFLSLVLITRFVYNLFSFSFKSALTRLVLLCQTVVVFFYRNERRRCFQSSSCKNRISYLNFPRTHVKVTVRYTVAKSTGNFFEERYLKYNYRLNERIATRKSLTSIQKVNIYIYTYIYICIHTTYNTCIPTMLLRIKARALQFTTASRTAVFRLYRRTLKENATTTRVGSLISCKNSRVTYCFVKCRSLI